MSSAAFATFDLLVSGVVRPALMKRGPPWPHQDDEGRNADAQSQLVGLFLCAAES